jgi:hypothetical protein
MLGVTILARSDAADFLKVMAILAALVHRSHFGMKAMSKGNRVILDFNFVDENAIGTELDVFNRCAGARASAQAGIGERGVAADVTLGTAIIGAGFRVEDSPIRSSAMRTVKASKCFMVGRPTRKLVFALGSRVESFPEGNKQKQTDDSGDILACLRNEREFVKCVHGVYAVSGFRRRNLDAVRESAYG